MSFEVTNVDYGMFWNHYLFGYTDYHRIILFRGSPTALTISIIVCAVVGPGVIGLPISRCRRC